MAMVRLTTGDALGIRHSRPPTITNRRRSTKMVTQKNRGASLLVKPAFHGACFGAVSAPILSARVPLRASAALKKNASTMTYLMFPWEQIAALINVGADKICYPAR